MPILESREARAAARLASAQAALRRYRADCAFPGAGIESVCWFPIGDRPTFPDAGARPFRPPPRRWNARELAFRIANAALLCARLKFPMKAYGPEKRTFINRS